MKKKKITVEINHKIDEDNGRYGFEMNIDDLISCLQKAKEKGAENICVNSTIEYDCSYIELSFTQERMETDEELNIRINKENQRLQEIKLRELEQLEKLKSKYGL